MTTMEALDRRYLDAFEEIDPKLRKKIARALEAPGRLGALAPAAEIHTSIGTVASAGLLSPLARQLVETARWHGVL